MSTDRFPTKAEAAAMLEVAKKAETLEGNKITVNVHDGDVYVSIDGINVFRARSWRLVEITTYSRPKPPEQP